ncbi:hypothetical protein JCM19233_6365 [Vibrio astriarenae]|nr:hypothetical protein JCM19233_6365 [Vibrio sp. C7]
MGQESPFHPFVELKKIEEQCHYFQAELVHRPTHLPREIDKRLLL